MRTTTTWTVVVVVVAAVCSVAYTADQQEQDEDTVRYDGAQVFRVAGLSDDNKLKLVELEEQGVLQEWGGNISVIDFFVMPYNTVKAKDALDKLQISYDVLIDDVQSAIDSENPPLSEDEFDELVGRNAKVIWRRGATWPLPYTWPYYPYFTTGAATVKREYKQERKDDYKRTRLLIGHRMTFQHYHRMDDIHGYLDYLAQTYPKLVSTQVIGNSVEDRPLKIVKISAEEPTGKAMWIDGGIHAREWISPASVSYIISELVENRETHLPSVKGIDFYILPLMNPDGYEHSHTKNRLWRKNRSRNFGCSGTDLNRNWGYKWGGAGSSRLPCKEIYAGLKAFSEPETRAVSKFILSKSPSVKAFVTFHSYGQYILYPWGYDRKVPPDHEDLNRVGRKAAEAMRKAEGVHYAVGSSATTLYAASGGADDWAKGSADIKYTYTIELRDTGRYGFILPSSLITPTAKESLAAVKAIAEEVQVIP